MSQELAVKEQQITKLANFQSAEEMKAHAEFLIKGGFIPKAYNKPEMVVSVVLQGRELGFGPLTALNNMYSISGRATLSVHGIAALMRRKGIVTETIKYFEPKMKADGTPSGDYETVIRFHQPFMGRDITEDCSYTWAEAKKMGLTDKDVWQKMPSIN